MFSPDVLVDGNNSPLIEISSDLSVVVRVEKHQPSELLDLAEVEGRIETQLIRQALKRSH